MKYQVAVEQRKRLFGHVWVACVALLDIPYRYYPEGSPYAQDRDKQKAIDKAINKRHQALQRYESHDPAVVSPVKILEVDAELPPSRRGPVWR